MIGLILNIHLCLLHPIGDSLQVYPCRFDSLVYEFVEVEPSFPGGEPAMVKFIRENLVYPEISREMGVQTRCYVSFVVDTTGEITCLRILNKLQDDYNPFEMECLRVISLMPAWIPGSHRGQVVPVRFTLPIEVYIRG